MSSPATRNALVELHEMRRRIAMDLEPGRFELARR